jgi:hypothetical protein
MNSDRGLCLRFIVVTATITAFGTLGVVYAVFAIQSRQIPPTPTIPPPKSIKITVYPSEFSTGISATMIPESEFDYAMRLLTPKQYFGPSINDWITPLVASVVITHDGQPDTQLLVRWTGKNPAAVSADGQHYFYGEPHQDVYDGASMLINLVRKYAPAKTE